MTENANLSSKINAAAANVAALAYDSTNFDSPDYLDPATLRALSIAVETLDVLLVRRERASGRAWAEVARRRRMTVAAAHARYAGFERRATLRRRLAATGGVLGG